MVKHKNITFLQIDNFSPLFYVCLNGHNILRVKCIFYTPIKHVASKHLMKWWTFQLKDCCCCSHSVWFFLFVWSLFYRGIIGVLSSKAILSLRKRKLVTLFCLVLTMLCVDLQFLIVVFRGHTHLLFNND